ncbi:MAG TPA: ribose-5-phosphate isomerase RpiA [Thermomicrobiales bacterium]|nr:ribose-5-phosphate isomerase RpiA [Thermomicrobiales bacterium]
MTDVSRDEHKRRAAHHAARLVENGMFIGLGAGTTAEQFVRAVGERVAAGLVISCVASSERTASVAREVGLPLVEMTGPIDLAVDGADAIERGSLSAIKGLGGAHTREKLIACAARQFVLVGDDGKLVPRLADVLPAIPVPVEVLTFGWRMTRSRLSVLGEPVLRVRDAAPFKTDNGHYILDLYQPDLSDPPRLGALIANIPGVVEHGLFLGMASLAVVSGGAGIEELWATTP